jgi:hypothetical protein
MISKGRIVIHGHGSDQCSNQCISVTIHGVRKEDVNIQRCRQIPSKLCADTLADDQTLSPALLKGQGGDM